MRFLLFVGLGIVLGYLYSRWVRRAAGSLSSSRQGQAVVEMVVRLVAFALVLGLMLYRFGSLAGIAVAVGMVLARSFMARSELKLRGH